MTMKEFFDLISNPYICERRYLRTALVRGAETPPPPLEGGSDRTDESDGPTEGES